MKAVAGFLFTICLILTVVSFVLLGVQKWHNYQKMQYLLLADDASLPSVKARYLDKFISVIESEKLPEYAAFVFKHERNKTSNQIDIIKSLRDRCSQLINIDVSSMGYATGMQQITGQEFSYAIDNTGEILNYALWVKAGWVILFGWIPCLFLSIIMFLFLLGSCMA